jgi:hypothetical protein
MAPEPLEVLLPHGVERDGRRRGEATLRPLTGRDEAWFAERPFPSAAAASSALLARAVASLGGAPATPADVRGLVAGDREALLLHLLRLAHGARTEGVLECPSCGEPMEVELDLDRLLVPPYAEAPGRHAVEAEGGRAVFRLPTGADLEAAAEAGGRGADVLLARCLLEAQDGDGRPLAAPLPPALAAAVDGAMRALDPQADLVLDLDCPACGAHAPAELDAGAFLARRMTPPPRLRREVHALALRYHWGEGELLALAPRERAAYLRLLDEDGGEWAA